MLTICAWCLAYLRGPRTSPRVSHGICGGCAQRETERTMDYLGHYWLDLGGEG